MAAGTIAANEKTANAVRQLPPVKRHPAVQDFMLANDSCTVACEVPGYLMAEEIAYYKSRGFFVTLPECPSRLSGTSMWCR